MVFKGIVSYINAKQPWKYLRFCRQTSVKIIKWNDFHNYHPSTNWNKTVTCHLPIVTFSRTCTL